MNILSSVNLMFIIALPFLVYLFKYSNINCKTDCQTNAFIDIGVYEDITCTYFTVLTKTMRLIIDVSCCGSSIIDCYMI